MCGCIVALAAILSPRFAIFLIWLFGNRMDYAFDSFWVGFIGFLFLPWTTLGWTIAYAPIAGVTGFGWFIVVLGFFFDISSYSGGYQARRARAAAA